MNETMFIVPDIFMPLHNIERTYTGWRKVAHDMGFEVKPTSVVYRRQFYTVNGTIICHPRNIESIVQWCADQGVTAIVSSEAI